MKCCNEVCKLCASCPKTTEFDGTPCAAKAARTVWSGGKSCDNFKGLPIAIGREEPGHEAFYSQLVGRKSKKGKDNPSRS